MKLRLTINGQDKDIEVAPGEESSFRYDNVEHAANLAVVHPGVYSILIEGRSYDATLERTGHRLSIAIGGNHFDVEIRDPRQWSPKSAPVGQDIATLASPMPGKVVRVLVAAGDRVEAGQGILVVEAMKMQNEIKTPRSGIVVSLAAREGATVTPGEPLATIE